jgi:hypothetical protein
VRRLWSRDHRFSLFCNSEYVLAHEGEDSSLSHDRTFHRGSNPREKENSKLKKYSDCLFSSSAPRGTCQARVPQTGGPWNVKPNNTVGFRRQLASRLERTHGCRSDRRRRPCRPGRHAEISRNCRVLGETNGTSSSSMEARATDHHVFAKDLCESQTNGQRSRSATSVSWLGMVV